MKNATSTLITSSHNITEEELIAPILDGIRPKVDPVVVHVISKLDKVVGGIY